MNGEAAEWVRLSSPGHAGAPEFLDAVKKDPALRLHLNAGNAIADFGLGAHVLVLTRDGTVHEGQLEPPVRSGSPTFHVGETPLHTNEIVGFASATVPDVKNRPVQYGASAFVRGRGD